MSWDSSHVRRLLSRWDYPAEAVDTLGRAMESAMGHPRTRALLDGASEAYDAGAELYMEGVLAQISDMAADCGEHPFTMQLLPYLRMLESAERRYAAVGISQEIYEATFADLLCKARECRRVYGVWGSFVASWFTGFFELKRFALGRLQFEFSSFEADEPLPRGERVINVHIPSNGPLLRDDCQDAYERAVGFFGYAHEEETPFVCDSWLLHPLCSELGASSRICQFAADYELLYTIDDPEQSDMWRIFDRPWPSSRTVEELPEQTALQRIFRRQLLSGGSVGRGYGLYLRPNRT